MMSSKFLRLPRIVTGLATRRSVMAFSTSVIRPASFSTRHENDAEMLEKTKHESLEKQKKGEADWHENLASDSEAFIKANREEVKHSDEEIHKLQKQTEELMNKKSPSDA